MDILIVDDEPVNLAVLARLVQMRFNDITVRGARNGLEALAAMRHTKPDLIMTDLRMPVMSGAEMIDILKQNDALKDIPILVFSGIQDKNTVVRLMKAGVEGYLLKPINAAITIQRIEEIRARLAQENTQQNSKDIASPQDRVAVDIMLIDDEYVYQTFLVDMICGQLTMHTIPDGSVALRSAAMLFPSVVLISELAYGQQPFINARFLAKKFREFLPESTRLILLTNQRDHLIPAEQSLFNECMRRSFVPSQAFSWLWPMIHKNKPELVQPLQFIMHQHLIRHLRGISQATMPDARIYQDIDSMDALFEYVDCVPPSGILAQSMTVQSSDKSVLTLFVSKINEDFPEDADNSVPIGFEYLKTELIQKVQQFGYSVSEGPFTVLPVPLMSSVANDLAAFLFKVAGQNYIAGIFMADEVVVVA